jgi:streptogramin lyase
MPGVPSELRLARTVGPSVPGGGELVLPVDVAVSDDGDSYVLDQGRNLVLWLDPAGNLKGEFGGFGWDEGELVDPASIALSPLGVYVTDPSQEALLKYDRQGAFVRRISVTDVTPELSLPLRPAGISVGPGGEVFVTEPDNGYLLRLDFSDRVEASFGVFGLGRAQLNEPRGLTVSGDRRVYLCDRGNARIQVLDWLGNVLYHWSLREYGEPWDVAVDGWGYCFVSVPTPGQIMVLGPTGAPVLRWTPPVEPGHGTFEPRGLSLGPGDFLHVADAGAGTVIVFSISRS